MPWPMPATPARRGIPRTEVRFQDHGWNTVNLLGDGSLVWGWSEKVLPVFWLAVSFGNVIDCNVMTTSMKLLLGKARVNMLLLLQCYQCVIVIQVWYQLSNTICYSTKRFTTSKNGLAPEAAFPVDFPGTTVCPGLFGGVVRPDAHLSTLSGLLMSHVSMWSVCKVVVWCP